MATAMKAPRFYTGKVVVTRGASAALNQDDILTALVRHFGGDWGELDEHDCTVMRRRSNSGGVLMSAYFGQNQTKFWVITEPERSVTTVLLPEEN